MNYDASDWEEDTLRSLFSAACKDNGWDEPIMADYDRYDEVRKCQHDSSER